MSEPFHHAGNPAENQTGFLVKQRSNSTNQPPPLPPAESRPSILSGLNGLVRGLNALFYALPLALLIMVWTATRSSSNVPSPFSNLLHSLGILPALVASVVVFYGVNKLSRYQPENVAWQRSIDRARWYGLFLIGLSPFLYWWCRVPENVHFRIAAMALIVIGMLFLGQLNMILRRLTQTLPDQTLRSETAFMAKLNIGVLVLVALAQVFFFSLNRVSVTAATQWLSRDNLMLLRLSEILVLLLMVLPVAITMAVMWKIKELILDSVFERER